MSARRYRGTEGQKLRQTEQMRRHLEQRRAAIDVRDGHINALRKKNRLQ
jgi:hypothetical protein